MAAPTVPDVQSVFDLPTQVDRQGRAERAVHLWGEVLGESFAEGREGEFHWPTPVIALSPCVWTKEITLSPHVRDVPSVGA